MARPRRKDRISQTQPVVESKGSQPEWGAFKTLVLTIVSGLLIVGFCFLPLNRTWLTNRIYRFYTDFKLEVKNTDLDHRKLQRWGGDHNVTNALNEALDSTSVFLIPPQTYLVRQMLRDNYTQFHIWTYPSLLYYYVDHINLVDLHSPDSLLEKATHTAWVRDLDETRDLVITQLSTKQRLDYVLNEFRKHELKVLFDPVSAQTWLNSSKDVSGP